MNRDFARKVYREETVLNFNSVGLLVIEWKHFPVTGPCAGIPPVTGEFPSHRPVTWNLDVFFHLRLNKWLSKQSWGWWFETSSHPLWRHCDISITFYWLLFWVFSIEIALGWMSQDLGEGKSAWFQAITCRWWTINQNNVDAGHRKTWTSVLEFICYWQRLAENHIINIWLMCVAPRLIQMQVTWQKEISGGFTIFQSILSCRRKTWELIWK